jgi:hypothetical protein
MTGSRLIGEGREQMYTGEIQFNQPYLDFLLTQADFSAASRILLLTGVIGPDDLPLNAQDKIVSVPLSEEPVSVMQGQDGFDLAIIVPFFGRYGDIHQFPESWDLPTASA